MAYTGYVIHSGEASGGYSTKNAQDLATVLEALDTTVQAVGDVTAAAAATAVVLGGTLTGTLDQSLADIGNTTSEDGSAAVNKNFKEVQDEIAKLIADVASIRTAVNAIIAAQASA